MDNSEARDREREENKRPKGVRKLEGMVEKVRVRPKKCVCLCVWNG